MKNLRIFIVLLVLPLITFAQQAISGTVTEKSTGSSLPGVDVIIKGTTRGTSTDFDGNYSLDDLNEGDVLSFSFLGYETVEIVVASSNTINVELEEGQEALDEIVIIGYGTTTIKDATGAIVAVKADDINTGATISADQLLVGKIAGVQVTTNGGSPGSGSTIRIRGGSSLSASNSPLIVIDGIPVDNEGIAGMRNPLNLVNPNDIDSYTILKDASATAIYGSRASNGVIIITTKRGKEGSPLKLNFTSNFSYGQLIDQVDVLSAQQFRDYVNANGTASDIALMGTASTNWQDEIYQDALTFDNNISAVGSTDFLTYRASIGYSDFDGILKTDNVKRTTISVGLGTKILEDHLKIDLNIKSAFVKNNFANQSAIGNAVWFDPTQELTMNVQNFGGYFEWLQPGTANPISVGAARNPVALLNQNNNESDVTRFVGNVQFDYSFHFLPELSANLNLGLDASNGSGDNVTQASVTTVLVDGSNPGNISKYSQEKENKLLDFYLNYVRDVESINSSFDLMAGYSYQNFETTGYNITNIQDSSLELRDDYASLLNLQSFFGRLDYKLADKYLLTLTYRADASSRFRGANKWGNFPSAAFGWKIMEEDFMQDSNTFSNLKLRLGWGITGQQDIGINNPSLATYLYSTNTAQYQFGNTFYNTLRAEPFNTTLKWEETTTYNVGIDFGFFNHRLYGSVDGYFRETKDLLNFVPFPGGSALSNADFANIGTLENKGLEITLTGTAIQTDDINLDLGVNVTFNETEITQLTLNDDPNYQGVPTGGFSGGVGNTIQIHSVGYAPSTYFVYQQVYDANGKPMEDVYVDRDGDGVITDGDKYRYKNPAPDVTIGFNTDFTYKDFDFTMSWRGVIGNYVYNNVDSNSGFKQQMLNAAFPDVINNGVHNVLETGFINGGTNRYLSDYYVQDASFIKLDNIGIGYNFREIFKDANLRLSGSVQNALTITDYTGLDPEVFGGIDNNLYPRPRTYTFGLNLTF
ncbi:MAG: TonB-dependent receptor [Flavobacteriaceae bacterium]